MNTGFVNRLFAYLLVSFFLILPQVFAAEQQELKGRLTITGSSTIAPLALEIAKRFEKEYPQVRIDVQTGGSSRGVADTMQGLADIGLASRAKHKSESELQFTTIAMDGIALITHKDNPVSTLTNQQVIAIFKGELRNWKELGGKDARITVVNKAEGRSTLELFLDYFAMKSTDIKAHIIIGDNEQGIKTVAGNPNAIGYVSIGTAEFSAKQGVPIRLLPLNGVEASVENVRSGSYPLARPLNLVTAPKTKPLAKAFIEHAQSEKVHDLVREQFFVPVAR